MQLPKTFSLKFSRLFNLAMAATAASLLFSGCQVMDEAKNTFDFPLASEYRPVIQREEGFTPKRILVLPVSGPVDAEYRRLFETELLAWLAKPDYWTVVEYAPVGSGTTTLYVDRFSAYKKAQVLKADAILYVQLSRHEAFSPIRFMAEVSMERTDTQKSVLSTQFDYNTQNLNVADSARRYYQRHMPRTFGSYDAPSKSKYILESNEGLMRFAGAHTARILSEPYAPKPVVTSGKK